MSTDWENVKTEYITTDISYAGLCKKYEIPRTTLAHRARKENWVELRTQHRDNIVTRNLRGAENEAVSYRSELYALAYQVVLDFKELIKEYSLTDLMKLGLKPRDITGAIKDLGDVLHIKSDADIEEQRARIEKFKRDADTGSAEPPAIEVTIEGGEDTWRK